MFLWSQVNLAACKAALFSQSICCTYTPVFHMVIVSAPLHGSWIMFDDVLIRNKVPVFLANSFGNGWNSVHCYQTGKEGYIAGFQLAIRLVSKSQCLLNKATTFLSSSEPPPRLLPPFSPSIAREPLIPTSRWQLPLAASTDREGVPSWRCNNGDRFVVAAAGGGGSCVLALRRVAGSQQRELLVRDRAFQPSALRVCSNALWADGVNATVGFIIPPWLLCARSPWPAR
ncbi:hypothetical protein GUJ93_ZPchr0012g21577 [Zizania palustris]|uniref:Uncharacterized protein n=1 Tax=Zizania palustris TaxID=103762 RepID=A0A8J6BUK3_ZIZPA|nr:hypothetical protein GUJ93_ZPchr0012g21577 [Zizania palustris]